MLDFEATEIVSTFAKMEELELVISDMYRAAADTWPEDRAYWEIVADDEVQHAVQLGKMAEIIQKFPLQFTLNRLFRAEMVQSYIDRVRDYTRLLKSGQLPLVRFNYLARDLENSILESRYNEILTTTNQQYQELLEKFMEELELHRQLFSQRIKEWE